MALPATAFAYLMLLIDAAGFVVALFALVDALVRKPPAFRAVGRGGKALWIAILGAAVAVSALGAGILNIVGVAGLVASIVYLVDLRPKLRELTARPHRGAPYRPR
ncbi:MAG: DUF2516 family protein [Mycobacteriales bacterium]